MEHRAKKKGFGGWVFLSSMILAYGLIAIVAPETAGQALEFSIEVMQNIWPVLLIVFFLLLVMDLLLKPEWIKHNLGKEAGIRGWLMAAAGGVFATGPVYAWYALLGDLREKGMRMPLAAMFLYSRAIKIPLLPLMIHYFGVTYTLVLCLYLLGFSIVCGILMARLEARGTI